MQGVRLKGDPQWHVGVDPLTAEASFGWATLNEDKPVMWLKPLTAQPALSEARGDYGYKNIYQLAANIYFRVPYEIYFAKEASVWLRTVEENSQTVPMWTFKEDQSTD